MLGLLHIAVGALFMLGIGGVANRRARGASARGEDLDGLTRTLMLTAFGGFGATMVSGAVFRPWALDLPPLPAAIGGGVLMGLGACIVALVFTGIRKRTWAVDTDKLATTGIYGRTRNPRALGWFLVYLGLGLALRSGALIVLAPIYLAGYSMWIMLEERTLERSFGEEYRAYRERVRRFI